MMSRRNLGLRWMWTVCLFLVLPCALLALKEKSVPKSDVAGHYEGTAKNAAGDVIDVKLDLTEKNGAISGMINSSQGDFEITGGSHHGEDVTLEFDANGQTGTITLKMAEDKLSGTWSAGDDGGPVEVKRVAAQEGGAKGKS